MNINITRARITGLSRKPYYFEPKCYYGWDIIFKDSDTYMFDNIPFIKMGDTEKEAENFCNKIKRNFEQLDIGDQQFVEVIFNDNGEVIAIGTKCSDKWIDTKAKFTIKNFYELKGLEGKTITSIVIQ